ncbi:MAG: hypothetical protein MN733_11885 [Nitrososphaera sp.]|nr:hypothetical protein [Nitrososphaera sp.]
METLSKFRYNKHRRCQYLDVNGKQCNDRKTRPQHYHGDGEIYSQLHPDRPGWVKVYLCQKHSSVD